MTKFFTTLMVVLCIGTTSFSQTKGTTQFGIGLGYNGATVTASNGLVNSDYRSGFNAGISVDHYFSDRWSMKGEFIYDQKGWANGYIGNSVTDYKLNYLTIPVLANWHFGRTRNWYLHFGPYVGILLDATATTGSQDVKSFFNTVDGGLDIGIGIKFPVANKTKFFIEFNGQGGVADIGKGSSGTDVKNSVSAFNIGLNFE